MITSIGVGSKSFQWDHRNRLTQSTVNTSSGIVTVNYAYDPFNRLVKRSAGFNTTYFGYDEGINPHLQMDTQTNNQITHRYLWSDQVDELFSDEQRLSGLVPDTKWALSDHQGTIKDIADFNSSTGQTSIRHRAYDSFGNRKGSALPTDIVFGYTGKYFDEATGMQNSWNRWYSPKMGRFISQDPIGFAAGDANLYRYVGNSPTLATDPSGLFGVGHHWITMSKLLGVADKFEKDALYVLIGAYSGLLENAHNRRRMDGISHSEYDKAIEQSLRDFLDARQGKGKVTPKEAKQFAQDVYEGKVFNKTNAASVKKFNTQVVKELRDKEGFLEPRDTPTERLIKQGKSYAQTDRGKEIMRAGKFLGILGGILSAAQMVEMAEASTSPLSAVFRSIAAGDYAGAERGLIGENAGSLISVLREKDPRFIYGEALFKEKVQTMISEIKDWDERFLNEK
jgi:RHS repeat-associated protein